MISARRSGARCRNFFRVLVCPPIVGVRELWPATAFPFHCSYLKADSGIHLRVAFHLAAQFLQLEAYPESIDNARRESFARQRRTIRCSSGEAVGTKSLSCGAGS